MTPTTAFVTAEGLADYVLPFGPAAEIVEPADARAIVAQRAEALARAHAA